MEFVHITITVYIWEMKWKPSRSVFLSQLTIWDSNILSLIVYNQYEGKYNEYRIHPACSSE